MGKVAHQRRVRVLRGRLDPQLRSILPEEDPYLAPGEMIVLQVSRKHRRRVVTVEIVKPFDD